MVRIFGLSEPMLCTIDHFNIRASNKKLENKSEGNARSPAIRQTFFDKWKWEEKLT
jgi:hypothetical protein